jgi:hypothetical protein
MRTRDMLTIVLTICVWTLIGSLAYGQSEEAPAPSLLSAPWKFDVVPYLWLPAMQGELTVRGHTVDVDISLTDELKNLTEILDSLQLAFMGRAEARKGPLLFTLDLIYVKLEDEHTTARGGHTAVTPELLITEFGAGYRLGTFALSPVVYPSLAVDFLAGGRYVSLEAGLKITGERGRSDVDVKRDVDWLEPFVGGRFILALSHRFTLTVRGDVGGFGVGSDLTWSLVGTFQYNLSRLVSLGLGYRALDIDYKQGSGVNLVKFDTLLHGPLLGVAFHF